MINLIFKKVVTSLLASFALSKSKQNLWSNQTHNWFTRCELNHRYFWRKYFCLRFPEHLFCWTHFSGCFLKLYYSYHVVFQWYFKTSKYIWICFCFFYLDTKSVVKINYGVPTHSATKLKKHRVQNWVNTDIFKHNFR